VNDSTAVTYTISSINANATKVIFDAQSSNFTYGSVGSGSGSKVGNTVEITGWTGTSVTVTLTYTTVATYSNRAKVTNSANAVYTDSAYSSTDSIVISASSTASVFDLFSDSSAKALYEMNGNSNDTGGNYNASNTGNITYTTGGPTGTYADFQTNQTDEIAIPLGGWMSNRTNFTVSLWTAARPTANTGWNYTFMLGNTSHSPQHYRLGLSHMATSTTALSNIIYPYNSNSVFVSRDVDGVWRHWVFSVASDVLTIYRDKVLVGTLSGNVGNCHTYISLNAIPALGTQGSGNTHNGDNSRVTQVRFFDRPVTTAEIAILYSTK
jgi:hypothetical protein